MRRNQTVEKQPFHPVQCLHAFATNLLVHSKIILFILDNDTTRNCPSYGFKSQSVIQMGDSSHHQISQVMFFSSVVKRRPQTHFFLPLLLLLSYCYCVVESLVHPCSAVSPLPLLSKVLLCRSDHAPKCWWML